MDLGIKNKVIVYTGAAGLIGYNSCLELAKTGAKLVLIDNNKESLDKLANSLIDVTDRKSIMAIHDLDILSPSSIEKMLDNILNKFSSIDCLVNSAYPRTEDWGNFFEDVKFESWQKNVDTHMNGYFLLSQRTAKRMIANKSGNIIFFSSIYGVVGPDFSIYDNAGGITCPVGYSAIKGGITNLSRYMASYLGRYNIRVNTISPGGVENNQNPNFIENYISKVPLRRMAQPQDITGALIFLISDLSKYVTGTNLMVDGGWTAI